MKPAAFVSIGECMIELSAGKGELWRLGFAGDTFNTAWYTRAILPKEQAVAYVTALGGDPFSQRMRNFIAKAGVETDRIREVERRPGLYAITLEKAERSFTYWRSQSAARLLADDPEWLARAVAGAELLYFSGITLAILTPASRRRLIAALKKQRRQGATIAFDPNFRPVLWPDRDAARKAMEAAYRVADIALPTFSDEAELFGDPSIAKTAERLASYRTNEFVIKNGDKAALLFGDGKGGRIPPTKPKKVVDTTGAGDSFGGAYLAGRLIGLDPFAAARLGHRVAAEVICVHGALTKINRRKVMQSAS
jgi:2-dehydro-3-deoxygluconokinase